VYIYTVEGSKKKPSEDGLLGVSHYPREGGRMARGGRLIVRRRRGVVCRLPCSFRVTGTLQGGPYAGARCFAIPPPPARRCSSHPA
jgi:hypothetical protein